MTLGQAGQEKGEGMGTRLFTKRPFDSPRKTMRLRSTPPGRGPACAGLLVPSCGDWLGARLPLGPWLSGRGMDTASRQGLG